VFGLQLPPALENLLRAMGQIFAVGT
jgi:hypothetical protein